MFFQDLIKKDDKYTAKVSPPQYLPSANKPKLNECYSLNKYTELMANIAKADIPEEDKEFLRFAATRHIVFNYSKVADYYAHSSKEVQELMEQSALVIIDVNDAIANGYLQLSKNIEKIMRESGKPTKDME